MGGASWRSTPAVLGLYTLLFFLRAKIRGSIGFRGQTVSMYNVPLALEVIMMAGRPLLPITAVCVSYGLAACGQFGLADGDTRG